MIQTPPDFFGRTTRDLEYGEVECWIRPVARYWFNVASTSFAYIGLIQWGREVTGALPSGTEISKGIREQAPKSVLDLDNTSAESQRTPLSCLIARGASLGHQSRKKPCADVTAVVARRSGTKRAFPGSNTQQGPTRARPWRPQLREVEPWQQRTELTQVRQRKGRKVRQRKGRKVGRHAAERPAERS